jgi:hypothetical protein
MCSSLEYGMANMLVLARLFSSSLAFRASRLKRYYSSSCVAPMPFPSRSRPRARLPQASAGDTSRRSRSKRLIGRFALYSLRLILQTRHMRILRLSTSFSDIAGHPWVGIGLKLKQSIIPRPIGEKAKKEMNPAHFMSGIASTASGLARADRSPVGLPRALALMTRRIYLSRPGLGHILDEVDLFRISRRPQRVRDAKNLPNTRADKLFLPQLACGSIVIPAYFPRGMAY